MKVWKNEDLNTLRRISTILQNLIFQESVDKE